MIDSYHTDDESQIKLFFIIIIQNKSLCPDLLLTEHAYNL